MSNIATQYWKLMIQLAWDLDSDGCTIVNEWHQMCCLEHDVHYRTGRRHMLHVVGWDGKEPVYELVPRECVTRAWADRRFRDCMRVQGGFFNDIRAWARWIGVRGIGIRPWRRYRNNEKDFCGKSSAS
jgi:hypothetical protein